MKTGTRSFYEAAVERAATRVAGSLDEALDLHDLAREAALSPFHFHRVFRGMVGETPLEMHRRLRLERAAARLLDGRAPVTTITFDAGYETHEAFTRAFKQAYGLSPSAFRHAARDPGCARPPQIPLASRSGIHFDTPPPAPPLPFLPGESAMHVQLVDLPALRVATVPHRGPYSRIPEAFARLGALAGPAGLIRPGTRMLALYHDDPESVPAEQLRSEAGVTVTGDAPLPSGLDEVALPAGSYATAVHVGPYATLGDAWARLMGEWLPGSGRRVGAGPSFEVYRNTPADTAPGALETELYLPLA